MSTPTTHDIAAEVGQRLAASLMPEILQRELLDALPHMGERELKILAFALRQEAAQLGVLERVLEDYEAAERARAPERLAAEEAAMESAIAKYLDDVAQESAARTVRAS